jgi:hypothetical protein
MEIMPVLPDHRGPKYGDELPEGILGSRIVNAGMPNVHIPDGAFVIDYQPSGSEEIKRAVLCFNESGIWIRSLISVHARATLAGPQ